MTIAASWQAVDPTLSGLSDLTATDPTEGRVAIYNHGYSVRLRLLVAAEAAEAALERCGWSWQPAARWRLSTPKNRVRWVMKGSTWLTGRAPKNKRLALAKKNADWKTRIYTLAVETSSKEGFCIDLEGVRVGDIVRFVTDVLELDHGQVELCYFRKLERYLVLTPADAHRLAEAVEAEPSQGKGRLARKEFMIRGLEVPVTIRKRAQSTAKVFLYRVSRGATFQYKLEARLEGKRSRRSTFGVKDTQVLDDLLLDMVAKHELTPTFKPARWEPRNFAAPIERGPFDPRLQKLSQKAWRGFKQKPRFLREAAEKCHTPHGVKLVDAPVPAGIIPPSPRIRTDSSVHSQPVLKGESLVIEDLLPETQAPEPACPTWVDGLGSRIYQRVGADEDHPSPSRPEGSGPWAKLAAEVLSLPDGTLTEVVLDANQDPGSLLRELVGHKGHKVGVSQLTVYEPSLARKGCFAAVDGFYSVGELMLEHPAQGDIDLWVVVIDPSTIDAVLGLKNSLPFNPAWGTDFPLMCRAMCGWLWPWLEETRSLIEKNGMSVVLVTTDTRPQHGRGPLRKTHYYRDARVRSWLGDATRYLAHQRYLADTDEQGRLHQVAVLKDEVEGLVGRLVYRRAGVSW